MKIAAAVIGSILALIFGVSLIPFPIEVSVNLTMFKVKVFGVSVYTKKDQKLYDFLVRQIKNAGQSSVDPQLGKSLARAVRIRSLEFSYGGDTLAPAYALTIGFLQIVVSFLRRVSFRDALIIRYGHTEEISLRAKFQIRPLEVAGRYLNYRRKKAHHVRQKG